MSASASAAPSALSAASGSRPNRVTASNRLSEGMYRTASHGISLSGSASITGAVNGPSTDRAARVSSTNLARTSGSAAYSG